MNHPSQPLDTINVGDQFAMRYWARQFRISEADLRKAIEVAGNTTVAVRRYVATLPMSSRIAGRPRA